MRETGTVVADRYVLESLLGEGGMAAVWAATHRVTGRAVALKFLAGDRANLEEARARFMREARAASLVQHPNVVPVHDVVTLEDGTLVMVMDRLFGETLRERLDHLGRLLPAEAAAIMVPVFSAVGTAHAAGVVHRDLKPENIFLTDEQDVKVLDFGIAKLMAKEHQGNLTHTGALLGTPYYMAPEQIFGERDLDARADVWSLGVILYECLTGERPFEGENAGQIMKSVLIGRFTPPRDHVPDLSGDLVELLGEMLEIDPGSRSPDLTKAFRVLSSHTATEAISFGSAIAPRSMVPPSSSLAPPPSLSSPRLPAITPASWPRIPAARTSTPSRPAIDPGAATELMDSSEALLSDPPTSQPDTQRSAQLDEEASLSDTLSVVGQERTLHHERSHGWKAVLGATVAVVSLVVGYLAWPRAEAPTPVAAPAPSTATGEPARTGAREGPADSTADSPPDRPAEGPGEGPGEGPVDSPVDRPADSPADPAETGPPEIEPSAAPVTVKTGAPRPTPPKSGGPPEPRPKALPHGVHGEVPF